MKTERWRAFLTDNPSITGATGGSVKDVVTRLQRESRPVLEVAATIHYLKSRRKLSGDAADEELRSLRGHLADHFGAARALLRDLRLEAQEKADCRS